MTRSAASRRPRPWRYRVRPAAANDLAGLPAIEAATLPMFAPFGLDAHFFEVATPLADFEEACRQGRLWVTAGADDRPVGFAMASALGAALHIDELSVHPRHHRLGLGSALVENLIDHAATTGRSAVTLLTLSHTPWQVPFYRRLGFRAVEPKALGPEYLAMLRAGGGSGPSPALRVVMVYEIETSVSHGASEAPVPHPCTQPSRRSTPP